MANRRRIIPDIQAFQDEDQVEDLGLQHLIDQELEPQNVIPAEDKQILSAMGFDVAEYVGEGGFGYVFSGVCNTNAKKKISVGPNEILEAPDSTYFDPIARSYVREVSLNAKPCAIKKFKNSEQWTDLSHNEAKTLIELDHPNIVEVYWVCKSGTNIYIIMEFLSGGSLGSYLFELQEKGEKLDEGTAYHMIRQMTTGLQYLHNQNKVHGDLHNENILLSFEGTNCLCKIADFGSSGPLTVATKRYDFNELVNRINEILDSTVIKRKDIHKQVLDLENKIIGSSMSQFGSEDINQILDELLRILPPIEVPKESSVGRMAKSFAKKLNIFS